MMYFLRADNVQIGDEMIVQKEAVQIFDVKLQRIKKKVAVETEDGTIEVNGVFASGLCDYNPDVVNRIVNYETYTNKYISNHRFALGCKTMRRNFNQGIILLHDLEDAKQ